LEIKFCTDGWRGIIAKDFTFDNVALVTRAIANYLHNVNRDKKVVIGYDNRFLSDEFAFCAGKVLIEQGIKVYMVKSATPTPVIAYTVKEMNADGAIMITASHNPPEHNGLKFIPHYAGPALPEITDQIVKQLQLIENDDDSKYEHEDIIFIDPKESYFNHIKEIIDIDLIKNSGLKVVVDPMFGAGVDYLDSFLADLGVDVTTIHNYRDVLFGGEMPEPKPELLGELILRMKQFKADLGLALDGDADRLAVADKFGNFISPNQTIALLMDYMINFKGYSGCVARTVATTHMLDRIGEKNDVKVLETPVGFKYIGQKMMEESAFIGGEESGGLSIANHIPEKDGILAALLVIEMVAKIKQAPSQIFDKLQKEFGPLFSNRLDIRCGEEDKAEIISKMKSLNVDQIANRKVTEKVEVDGLKYLLEDNSWVLVRPSGTEAVFRIYAESKSNDLVKEIQKDMCRILNLDYNRE